MRITNNNPSVRPLTRATPWQETHTSERERKLAYFETKGQCPACYKAAMREAEEAMGLVASVRLPALSTLLSDAPFPTLAVVFDGDTLPHKDAIKAMGATYTEDYPAKDSFSDLLNLDRRPKRWVLRITHDQLDQLTTDLEALGCKTIDYPNKTSLAMYLQAFQAAKDRAAEGEKELSDIGPIPQWPSAFSALWPQDARWNGKIYGKPGNYSVYFSGKQVSIPDNLKSEVEAAQAARAAWREKAEEIKRS